MTSGRCDPAPSGSEHTGSSDRKRLMSVLPHPLPPAIRTDLAASLVVFLVALPLCIGIAVASGVPAELGLVTGIVGGLVTGFLPGSSLQVSGPAAGLTVLVFEAIQSYGLGALGVIVLMAGLLQVGLGVLKLGRWFRAISVAVVEGMLAGIGLLLIAGQLYAMTDTPAPASSLGKLIGLPGLAAGLVTSTSTLVSFALGIGTITVIVVWSRMPSRARAVPGALVAVLSATTVAGVFDLRVATVNVQGLLGAIQPPSMADLGRLGEIGLLTTVLAVTLIASAESLFSAAAVDRLHTGPRTHFDKELVAQGIGNTVCGLLGALPMTAVIVRSAANVDSGATTKASRVLHGLWLLLFAALLPATLALVPLPALAGVLVYAGFKLLPVTKLRSLWCVHRAEATVLLITALAIVALNMFEGVLIGLGLAIVKAAWETSHVQIAVEDGGSGPVTVAVTGNATFLRLPAILSDLEALPSHRPVDLDLAGLSHLDHACHTALTAWADRRNAHGDMPVRLIRSA